MTERRAVDELLPEYDVHEVHRRRYAADAVAVRLALEGLRASDLPVTRVLMAVRTLPSVLLGGRARRDSRPLLDQLTSSGFARVVDTPGEAAFAVVGRFWRPDGDRRPPVADAAEFASFAEPGVAKAVMSFELRPVDGGTELVTETRVLTTSAGARRAFLTYWRVVGPFSALIRRELLAAVARRLP